MPSKIDVMNEALKLCNEPLISSPTEDNDRARHTLGSYDAVCRYCLEQGAWNFAMKRVALGRTDDPPFGFGKAYIIPQDCARITFVSPTGIERDDLKDYALEGRQLLCDADAVYLRYVSYELMVGREGDWPQVFADWVSAQLSLRIAPHFNLAGDRINLLVKLDEQRRSEAMAHDSMQQAPVRWNAGRWATARFQRGPRSNNQAPQ